MGVFAESQEDKSKPLQVLRWFPQVPKKVCMHVSLAMQGWSLLQNKLQCKDTRKEVKENTDECPFGQGWGRSFYVETTKEKVGRFEVLTHVNLEGLNAKTTIRKSKR